MAEFRFGVGSPQGLRSTIWKIYSGSKEKSDVYIQSRMMGSDMKISLHESGICQCSLTNEWVRKFDKRNAERHILRWQRSEPISTSAVLIFQIIIPESELRQVDVKEKLQKVKWLETPQPNQATRVVCYLAPPMQDIQSQSVNFPYPHLFSFQLPNKYWFVMLFHNQTMTEDNVRTLNSAHSEIRASASKAGIELKPEFRASVGTHEPTSDLHGIIEIAPISRENKNL
jgi:hypothetical protein